MSKPPTIGSIIAGVAEVFDVSADALTSRSQRRHIFAARAACAYILRRCVPALGLVEIGQILGGRDHTTIMNALARVEEQMRADPSYAELIRILIAAYQPAAPLCGGAEIRRQFRARQREAQIRWAQLSMPYRPIAA